MAGGGQNQNQNQGTNAGSAAQVASTAGSAGAGVNNMPQWQKGLLGAMTGSTQYGQNAPVAHSLLASGMGMLSRPTNAAPQMPTQRPMGGAMPGPSSAPGAAAAAPMMPSASPGMGMAPAAGMPQGAMQGQGQSQINPQMLAMLRQQYPAMFGGASG